ncbi:unnamed protein product, partial [Schistosoma turkestanicum]
VRLHAEIFSPIALHYIFEFYATRLNTSDLIFVNNTFCLILAVRQRAVACKLDQVQKKILITGAFPRTFGRPQWINLRDTLIQWKSHLGTVQSSLSMMVQNESA